MQKSESIKEIAIALNKVQSKIVGAVKDSANPFFKSKYASLESVMDAVQKPFQESGLSYIQASRVTDSGGLVIQTIIMHTSGEWIMGEYPVKAQKDDPQGLGSAMTYARRYSLSAMCGVAQVDDDGQAAMQERTGSVSGASIRPFGNQTTGTQTPKIAGMAGSGGQKPIFKD